ncbi:MAG: accessory gene regulator B family protein [Clostridia bacterium]|nr:accessory gene regulator B family protein [Clostridia bacterium]
MIDKICTFLTNKIRKEMPEIDDERAEVINYGLQNIVGEIPKIFIMLAIAYVLGIFKLALFTFIVLLPYKGASGGVHLKTHIGCIILTTTFYCLIPFVAEYIVLSRIVKYILIGIVWIFGMIMIKLYAPADTENVPILNKKDRRKKQIISYVTFTIGLIAAGIIQNSTISNILILGNLLQTLSITKLVYRLTNNKYGYEVYQDTSMQSV